MHDTDRIPRAQVSFADLTPTTAPIWRPALVPLLPARTIAGRAGGKRLARGTVPSLPPLRPRPSTVIVRQELPDSPALPLQLVPAGAWGLVARVDLDGELVRTRRTARPVEASALDPRVVIAVLAIAMIALLAILVAGLAGHNATHAPAASPSPSMALVEPATQLVITPIEVPLPHAEVVPEVDVEIVPLGPVRPVDAPAAPRALALPAPMPISPASAIADIDGLLAIGAKPPCRIVIDGHDTGLVTPQRAIWLPAGRHEITLINAEYGIEDHTTVHVGPGSSTRLVRDLSAHLER